MKRQILRAIVMLPVIAVLSGCIVYDGRGGWHPHYFHER
jgi:hypothetical protein